MSIKSHFADEAALAAMTDEQLNAERQRRDSTYQQAFRLQQLASAALAAAWCEVHRRRRAKGKVS